MFKKKKYRRQLNKIGKEKYDFDINEEIKYYNYLSCSYLKKKDIESIDDKYKFDSYKNGNNISIVNIMNIVMTS